MSIVDQYNIQDPELREVIIRLEELAAQQTNVQQSDIPITASNLNNINPDQIKVYGNKIFFRSGTKLYSIEGDEET